jgi:hypothetical protein
MQTPARQASAPETQLAPPWSKQHACPRRPQATHRSPPAGAVTARQVVSAALQVRSQQRCPALPHMPQAPLTHTDPLLQSCPSSTQVPGSPAALWLQQPLPHRLSGQHTCPGPPHARHIGDGCIGAGGMS